MKLEKARISDVTQMHQLINYYADKDEMLARPLSELYESIRDFFVVRQDDRVIACAALHISWSDLAEIRSVAVAAERQQQGIGSQLVETCLGEAKELGIPTVRLECDLVDERIFAQSQAYTRLDAFAEALLQKGSIAHGN